MIEFIALTQLVTTNNTALSLICTLYKSLEHAKSSRSSLVVSWQRIYKPHCNFSTHKIFKSHAKSSFHRLTFKSQLNSQSASESESQLLYDWRFTANQFILATSLLRLTTSNFFHLNTWGHRPYITSSLTRGWVCRLQVLLLLPSTVILRSESPGTHDHILLKIYNGTVYTTIILKEQNKHYSVSICFY
jgi:hypothetical protein